MAKSKPKLTIGMCTYDDFDGTYFTIQSIRVYHSEVLDDIEFVVIDNNPDSKQGKELKKFLEEKVSNSTYIPFTEYTGCGVRSKLFEYAKAPAVLCMDCHVLLESGSLKKLIDYYDDNPNTEDLLQGPLVWEKLNSVSTHFDMTWRASMWGTWQTHKTLGSDPSDAPFEIPAMGLGLFSCRKDAWLGFNEHFREFGGEEVYIHEKFRQHGRKTLCLPFLRWVHRFYRPGGPPYKLSSKSRIRNYLIGHMELKLSLDEMIDHFESEDKMNQDDMKKLILDVMNETGYKPIFEDKDLAKVMNPFKKIEL